MTLKKIWHRQVYLSCWMVLQFKCEFLDVPSTGKWTVLDQKILENEFYRKIIILC